MQLARPSRIPSPRAQTGPPTNFWEITAAHITIDDELLLFLFLFLSPPLSQVALFSLCLYLARERALSLWWFKASSL